MLRKTRCVQRKRRLSWCVSILWLLSLFTGCASTGSKTPVDYQVELEAPPAATDKLVLYRSPYLTAQVYDFAVPIFKAKFPNIEVELRDFGQTNNGADDREIMENYQTVLQTELMAGGGPDLVLWDQTPLPGDFLQDGFGDLYKLMDAGAFYNLDNFIAADPDFNLEDYSEPVLAGGMYRGKRQYIPLSYSASTLVTSKEALDAERLALSEHPTFEEFSQAVSTYCQKHTNDPDKWPFYYSDKTQPLCMGLYPFNGLQVVDYEREEVMVDSDAFRKTMELYRQIHPSVYTRVINGQDYPQIAESTMIAQRNVLFNDSNYGTLFRIGRIYGGLLSYGETSVIFGMPNVAGEKPAAVPGICAAIPQNAANKANAYEFLKILLSDTVQTDQRNAVMDIPVQNEARREKITVALQYSAGRAVVTEELGVTPLSDEQVEMVIDLLSDVQCITGYSQVVGDMIWEEMLPYFDEEKDYESCANNLENKLKLYVAE